MRIDALNQVTNLYKTTKARKTETAAAVSGRDVVQISQVGRDYQIAKQAVAKSPEVREDKVATLKAQIDSGKYQVNPEDFAAKLLEKYQAYR
ncbi:hypothetical protein FACS1894111_05040 [Clostridia bacterium]|nr:hypothetical protein FACS1894111_05040 [Clostridia bacterium]